MDERIIGVMTELVHSSEFSRREAAHWRQEAEAYKQSVQVLNGEVARLRTEATNTARFHEEKLQRIKIKIKNHCGMESCFEPNCDSDHK